MKDIEKILKEVVATMELSDFNTNDQEKEILLQVIRGEKSCDDLKFEVLKKIKSEFAK